MKKIKLLAPTVVLAAGAVAPVAMLTSCGTNNTNKVYLADGETAEKTVSPTTNVVTYKFKQTNLVSPEEVKVNVANLKVNNVSVSNRSKTFMYNKDSAGNIVVRVYTSNVLASWSDVSTFSFDLLFTNKKAGTKHLVGPFTINFDTGSEVEIDTSASTGVTFTSLNGNPVKNGEVVYKVLTTSGFLPTSITITRGTETLVNGKDYAWDRNYYYDESYESHPIGWLYIPCATSDMKITINNVAAQEDPYTYCGQYRCGGFWGGTDWSWDQYSKKIQLSPGTTPEFSAMDSDGNEKLVAKPTVYDVTNKKEVDFNWQSDDTWWTYTIPNADVGTTYIIAWKDEYTNATPVEESFVVQIAAADKQEAEADEAEPDIYDDTDEEVPEVAPAAEE